MSTIHGFALEREEAVEEVRGTVRIYRHEKTGARVMSVLNDDENKVFGITFRTPPKDSTGVPHILEHSVLCGSRKYPVKEPFVELLKGSLQTFLNAFTYPDKTCYPVASANLQDFYNLVDVYLDAVFHPRIDENVFKQEGWHYELDSVDGPLTYKGVVYNEMKGAYSSPDSLLYEYSQQAVFPDTTYGLDSGGHPAVIPDLTFEQFRDFHRTLYHPANAWAFFYGDDDPEKRLEILAAYLDQYEAIEVDSAVGTQAPFAEPKTVEKFYASGGETQKGMVTVSWLLPETVDVDMNFSLRVLEEILIGMPSSPLRKALIDSGLGEDIAGVGMETELKQMYFSTGLKGVQPEDMGKVEGLILDTLQEIADRGVEENMLEAAVNTIEFDLRENNTGRYPRGLSLMVRCLTTWLYEADPLAMMKYEGPLARLKERLASGEKVFETLVREHLLENAHRVTLLLRPDGELAAKRDAEEKERLAKIFAAMSEDEKKAVIEATETLHRLQMAPDSPEALATIPMLEVADLPPENTPIPKDRAANHGVELLTHDIDTSGIVYLDLGFDLKGLPAEYLPWVPLFGRALTEMGTFSEDYVSLTRRIAAKTGGIDASTFTTSKVGGGYEARLVVRAKSTLEKSGDLTAILHDILTGVKLDNPERFRQMVLEEKARMEQALVPSGHMLVASRLGARFSPSGFASERMGGVEYLFFLRDLARKIDADWGAVYDSLMVVRDAVINRKGLIGNLTLDAGSYNIFDPRLGELLAAIPEGEHLPGEWAVAPMPKAEGLTIPAQVNYVGKAASLYDKGYEFKGTALAVARYLRTAYLWDEVRVQGGAYGAFSMFNEVSGTLAFVSYRDPNLERTLKVFDGARDYLEKLRMSEDELTKAVVGSIGDLDAYKLPDAKGWTSFVRHLIGRTDEQLQEIREQILNAKASDFTDFAEAARLVAEHGDTVVLGSEESLKAVPGMEITTVL